MVTTAPKKPIDKAKLDATFQELIKNPEAELFIDAEGELVISAANQKNTMSGRMKMGGFSRKRIKQYFDDNNAQILELMNEWREKEGGIWQLQKVLNEKLGRKHAPNLGQAAYENWMTRLPKEKRDQPISQLMLPASHDSAAYKVDYSHLTKGTSFVERMTTFIKKVPLIGKWVGNIIADWTKTQNSSIYDQLKAGIRVLDLRVSFDATDGNYYLSHTFCCMKLKEGLSEIKRFLAEHPQEMVIIEMTPDHEHRLQTKDSSHSNKILAQVQEELGGFLQGPTDLRGLTLNQMAQNNKRAIFSYFKADPATDPASRKNIWTQQLLASEWVDTSNMQVKVNKMEQRLDLSVATNSLLEISATLTPQKSDIIKSVASRIFPFGENTNLETLSEPMNYLLAEKLRKEKKWRKAQVVSADQFEKSPLVETIIQINQNRIN